MTIFSAALLLHDKEMSDEKHFGYLIELQDNNDGNIDGNNNDNHMNDDNDDNAQDMIEVEMIGVEMEQDGEEDENNNIMHSVNDGNEAEENENVDQVVLKTLLF